jgi:hypothetical protein
MTEERETLRLKMVEHQDIARGYRLQIDQIDRLNNQAYHDKKVGKYYRHDEHSYFRIERFDYDSGRYEGTKIWMYTDNTSTDYGIQIEFKSSSIFDDYLTEGSEIDKSTWDALILKVKKHLANE